MSISIPGGNSRELPQRGDWFDHDLTTLRAMTAELIAMLAERRINPLIGNRFPLAQAAQAHWQMEAGGGRGKIILLPDSA